MKTTAPADQTTTNAPAPAPAEPVYYAVRDFRDAGTEDQFTKDEEVRAPKGRMGNYIAARLVTTDKPGATAE